MSQFLNWKNLNFSSVLVKIQEIKHLQLVHLDRNHIFSSLIKFNLNADIR